MARNEADKEDLIRDATALVERAEIVCDDIAALITIGFFRDGRGTIYLDQDPFYQFDAEGRLRRAYEDGFLYRSEPTTLARIHRERTSDDDGNPQSVTLRRQDLTAVELQEFRDRMTDRLQRLRDQIATDHFTVRRAVTSDGGLPSETLTLLDRVLDPSTEFIAAPASAR